jgi:hypothetical protein
MDGNAIERAAIRVDLRKNRAELGVVPPELVDVPRTRVVAD